MPIEIVGLDRIHNSLLNKGTAFTENDREKYGLHGLLPCNIETIENQLCRVESELAAKNSDIEKHVYLRALQDRNEVLFYKYIVNHIQKTMPIIYTPVVGDACEQFHRIYRQPRGLFVSYPERHLMDKIFSRLAKERDVRVIVVTDGERILGLGDQGTGGLGIPIGKLALYSACGGIHPKYALPVILDVGTNNQQRLQDPEYLGWRHERIIGEEYNQFVDNFISALKKYFPNVLLQFEDFAQQNAYPLLEKYRDELCVFNDDIQGTASVVVAAVLAAIKVSQVSLKDHRIAVFGAGSAGCGISEQLVQAFVLLGLTEAEARKSFYLVDRDGLLHDKMVGLLPFQQKLLQPYALLESWGFSGKPCFLEDVVQFAKPTILIGVSGQPNQFTESIVRKMAAYCQKPIIFPLSNPTSRAEAIPSYLLQWTEGRALIATGSPFIPVHWNKSIIEIAQSNNVYIFPGIGLAVLAGNITKISDKMMLMAAFALSELAPAIQTGVGQLLPPIPQIREVSVHIAKAVLNEAIKEGFTTIKPTEVEKVIQNIFWEPDYD